MLIVGDGMVGKYNDGKCDVQIPDSFLVNGFDNSLHDIVHSTYLLENFGNVEYFKDRAILVPTLDEVNLVNEYVMTLLPFLW